MDRRGFLGFAAALAGSLMLPQAVFGQRRSRRINPGNFQGENYGWSPNPDARQTFIQSQAMPFLRQQNTLIEGSGAGKKALWYRMYEKITKGPLIPHEQGIGDCVSHGFGLGVDFLTCHQIEILKKRERWVTKCATEAIYGLSRVEVGKQRNSYSDGSTGVWAAEAISTYGILLRQKYKDFDFTTYDPEVAKQFGAKGLPDVLEPLAKEHPVQTVALVNSWEECRDAIYNGHMVAMCSNLGFGQFGASRDNEGFLRRSRRPWYHCMFLGAMDDESNRPGALAINSWGPKSVVGPKRHDQPDGSFWIDAENIDNAMKQGDSIAMSAYVGYPRVDVPSYVIW